MDLRIWSRNTEGGIEIGEPRRSARWESRLAEVSTIFGKNLNVAMFHEQWMEEAGFVNIRVTSRWVSLGRRPKDAKLKRIGVFLLASLGVLTFKGRGSQRCPLNANTTSGDRECPTVGGRSHTGASHPEKDCHNFYFHLWPETKRRGGVNMRPTN
jgi:hypothetical protein